MFHHYFFDIDAGLRYELEPMPDPTWPWSAKKPDPEGPEVRLPSISRSWRHRTAWSICDNGIADKLENG